MNQAIKAETLENLLRAIHSDALNIVQASDSTGDVDFSDTESMFESMQEVAAITVEERYLSEELRELYNLCKLTAGVPSLVGVEDLNGSTGLPADCEELPIAVVEACVALRSLDDTIKGVQFLANAALVLDSENRAKFISGLAGLLQEFDLLGEEAVEEIFNAKNQT